MLEPSAVTPQPEPMLQIVPFPIGEYADTRRHPPFDADGEAKAVTDLLIDHLGGIVVPWGLPARERNLAAVGDRLGRWARPELGRCSVLVWIGHGESDDEDATLIVPGGRGAATDQAFTPEAMARQIRDEHRRRYLDEGAPRWTIVLVEACGAGRFVELVAAELLQRRVSENLLLIGVGEPAGSGYLAVACGVLQQIFEKGYANDTEIRLIDLADRIEGRLPFGRVFPLGVGRCVLTRDLPAVTAPLDVFTELQRVLADLPVHERSHFARKGMGADFGELAWHFVGRQAELDEIARWVSNTSNGLLIVTGRAGTGKSAVLGNLLIRSRPSVRELLTRAGLLTELAADAGTDHGSSLAFDVALQLTGLTVADVVASVIAGAGLPPLDLTRHVGTPVTSEQLAEALVAALRDGQTPLVLLADALDEAQQPLAVAGLLRDLATLAGVRVVVGTRASTREGPDHPETHDTDLLDTLDPRGAARRIVIRRDSSALRAYLQQHLEGLRSVADPGPDDAVAHVVHRVVGSDLELGEGREFLYARMLVHEILADVDLLGPHRRPDLDRLLAGNHRTLFAAAISRLQAASATTGALLHALAFAHGRGLPRANGLWAVAAAALLDAAVTDQDVDRALDCSAPYIMLDAESGQSVFRLAHRTFAEHYYADPERQLLAERVLAALLDDADRTISGDPDLPLNAYLVDHLPEQAASAGAPGWQLLADRPDLLDRVDPGRIADEAVRVGFGRYQMPAQILAVVTAAHLLANCALTDRRGILDLASARHGVQRPALAASGVLGGSDGPSTDTARWRVRTAALRGQQVHRSLTGHTNIVTEVAAFTGPDGRILLATTSRDKTVRIWDPVTGTAVGVRCPDPSGLGTQ